jgi:hypothetical protein
MLSFSLDCVLFLFCFSRLVYPMLPVSPDCVVFLSCFPPSCLPYVASFSGLTAQSRENGNIGQKRRRETKQKHNTIQRNWQHRVDKTERNKTKAQHKCCVFVLPLSVLSILCCQFLWIVLCLFLFVLSIRCCHFLWIVLCFCFVSLRLVYPMLSVSLDCVVFLLCLSPSFLPYVAIFSG